MLTLDVLTVIGFIVAFIGVSAATADVTGIEKRLRHLDRGDPATAEAVRRAQAVTDLARGGFFGLETIAIICTPSRRSLHLSGDEEVVEPVTVLPEQPAAVAAVAAAPQGRHLVARRARPRRRLVRGIRRLLTTRAERTALATSRPPTGSR
ncbi:hypothetical protein [Agromyces humatus]|uniref:CNNM transmembrane domain-containing protein n=1 Tax=Agromyces humatus TaxID=279573 RepID=A0ABP4WW22_9MICO|nr:hypothetical protein [Agromyces humatus]